jgi:hypothetical protein
MNALRAMTTVAVRINVMNREIVMGKTAALFDPEPVFQS